MMARLLLTVCIVLYCGVVRSDSAITTDASEVVLLVARIEQSLLLGLEILLQVRVLCLEEATLLKDGKS